MPPTTGGSTSGRVTAARSTDLPGKCARARTQASGVPNTRLIAVTSSEVSIEIRNATQNWYLL